MRRIIRADNDTALAGKFFAPAVLAGMVLAPTEERRAGKFWHAGPARHAGGQHQMAWLQRDRLALAHDLNRPLLRCLVEGRAQAFGRRPVVQLHQLGIGLEPVAHLVLRRVNRPVVWERQVGQVVVPDRVVQAERLVALAPGVAGLSVLVNDQRGYTQLLEPCAQTQPTLAAADDQAIGLTLVTQLSNLGSPRVRPVAAAADRAVLGTQLAGRTALFLETLEFLQGCEQRPAAAMLEPDMALASAHRSLEAEPGLNHTLCYALAFAGLAVEHPVSGLHPRQRVQEHCGDSRAALERGDVPGEGDQIAPIGLVAKQRCRGRDIAPIQRG